jgi:UDP-N-acetylmuramate--alanine ligase
MKIHMIGIGGAGMSGIAEVLTRKGHEVTGSDLKESPYTERLVEAGVEVYIGHEARQVGDADQVVVSTAIPRTNPEYLEAERRSIPVLPRAAALATIIEDGRGVAVAGTHGKTTTTSMTTHVLRALGEDPTALVGGELNDIGSNVAFGKPGLVVAEADESDRSLLHLHPEAAIITNVEFDHPDFYSSLEDVIETFQKFVASLSPEGHLVVCADDANCMKVAEAAPCPVATYGIVGGDLRAEISSSNSYALFEDGEERGLVELGVHGRHNILNSLAAASIARWLGHDAYEAARTLSDFGGVRRRFQLKGVGADVRVVDDYAHHPTEVLATLDVARATTPSDGRVVAVFQPHRYSRTRRFYREFGESFGTADAVVVTEVYGAGEMPEPGVSGKLIVDAICETQNHPEVYYVPDQEAIPNVLRIISGPNDTVITLGAGDVSRVGEELLAIL